MSLIAFEDIVSDQKMLLREAELNCAKLFVLDELTRRLECRLNDVPLRPMEVILSSTNNSLAFEEWLQQRLNIGFRVELRGAGSDKFFHFTI